MPCHTTIATPCAACGYCPTCGRGSGYVHMVQPYYPMTTPMPWVTDGALPLTPPTVCGNAGAAAPMQPGVTYTFNTGGNAQ